MIDWDAMVLTPCMATFGEANDALHGDLRPIYTPAAGGDAFPVDDAVFDDGYTQKVLLDDGTPGFVTSDPVLGVRLALFAATPVADDQVFIPRTGGTYVVNQVQPDSHGWALLQLNLMAAP